MQTTGIVRNLDELGRIVLPIELRHTLSIETNDPLKFFLDEDRILIKKYHIRCIFCGADENLARFKDKAICEACAKSLVEYGELSHDRSIMQNDA